MGEDYYTMYQAKEWAGIRIHISADDIAEDENLSAEEKDKLNFLVHKLAPAAVAWLSHALRVVPVKGNLRMGARGAACAGLPIPNTHRSPGVEADVIFYLSAEKTVKGELGWSKPCFIDQFGRPTAARINLSPCYLDPTATGKAWDRQVAIFLHEAIHALGFDSFAFARFRDAFDPRVSIGQAVKPFYEKHMQVNKIVTPRATEAARAHFGCPKINGLPLENQERAPVLGGGDGVELVVDPDTGCARYIVKLKSDTSLHRIHEIGQQLLQLDGDAELPLARANVTGNFSLPAFKGLVACLTVAAVEWVRSVPEVKYIEADAVMAASEIQSEAVWGLDRIDGTVDGSYDHGDFTGEGVVVFILDTGVNSLHEDLAGRVLEDHYFSAFEPADGEDCQGHGTHCAGTVAGTKHGVAKMAEIVSVRVLGCDGTGARSAIIDGILHTIQVMNLPEMEDKRGVLSMSLGGAGYSQAQQDAIEAAIEAGMPVVVAAGNDASDACDYSPAAVPAAVTVGASDSADVIASFSNFGTCVDIFAPGVEITSADWENERGYKDLQGTSMACPHVAGVAALFMQQNPDATGEQIQDMLIAGGMPGVVKQLDASTVNLLLKVPTGSIGTKAAQFPESLDPDEPRPPRPKMEGEAGDQDDPSWDLPEPPAPPVVVPHLEARLFKGELMTPHSPEEVGAAVSIFTLAVLEDSGWYKANYSLSQPLPWGRGAGCRFVTDQCISDPAGHWPGVPTNTSITVSERHFCTEDGRVGCTVDRSSKATCDVVTHDDAVPTQFQYFLDDTGKNAKHRGGRNGFADFCPVYEPLPPSAGGDCTDDTVAVGGSDFLFGEKHGADARCFVTHGWMRVVSALAPPEDSPRTARCFRHECTASGILLHFPEQGATGSGGEATVLCPKIGGTINAPNGFMGTLNCPQFDELCARSPLNGCPNGCSGKGTCLMGKCFCDPGAMGEDCAGTICENNCHADKFLGYCTSHTYPPSCWCRSTEPVAADCSPLVHYTNGMPLLAVLPEFNTSGAVVLPTVTRTQSGASPLSGSFTLSFDGATTAPISHQASQFEVREELLGLIGLDSVGVSRTDHVDGSKEWVVTFYSPVGNVPLLKANTSALITTEDTLVDVTSIRKGKALGGTFQLLWGNVDDGSDVLSHDASEAAIAEALAPWVGQVAVFKHERITDFKGIDRIGMEATFWRQIRTWSITFTELQTDPGVNGSFPAARGDVKSMQAIASNPCHIMQPTGTVLWLGANDCWRVREIKKGRTKLTGNFSISYHGETTRDLLPGASEDDVAAALRSLPSLAPKDGDGSGGLGALSEVQAWHGKRIRKQVNDVVYEVEGSEYLIVFSSNFTAPVHTLSTVIKKCINPTHVDWDPEACPNTAPDLWLSYNRWYWPYFLKRPTSIGTAADQAAKTAACATEARRFESAGATLVFECEHQLVPEWQPWCCHQDPAGCSKTALKYSTPPCWVSRPGYSYEGPLEDWEVYDAIVTVPHRDGTLHNWTRLDWEAPTLYKKGYRYWMECDNMDECVAKARSLKPVRVNGINLDGCTEVGASGGGCTEAELMQTAAVQQLECDALKRSWDQIECKTPPLLTDSQTTEGGVVPVGVAVSPSYHRSLSSAYSIYAPLLHWSFGGANAEHALINRGLLGEAGNGMTSSEKGVSAVHIVSVLNETHAWKHPSVFTLNMSGYTTVEISALTSGKGLIKALTMLPPIKALAKAWPKLKLEVEQLEKLETSVIDVETGCTVETWRPTSQWRLTFDGVYAHVPLMSGKARCAKEVFVPNVEDPFTLEAAALCCGNCSAREAGYGDVEWWRAKMLPRAEQAPYLVPCPCVLILSVMSMWWRKYPVSRPQSRSATQLSHGAKLTPQPGLVCHQSTRRATAVRLAVTIWVCLSKSSCQR
jgi:hypothetical protein